MENKLSHPVSIAFDFDIDGKMACRMSTSTANSFDEVLECMSRAKAEMERKIESAQLCPFSNAKKNVA